MQRPYLVTPMRAGALIAFALAAAAPRAVDAARDEVINPLTRHIESVSVAPGVEHRLLIVHPVHRMDAPAASPATILAHTAAPDRVAVTTQDGGRQRGLRIENLGEEAAMILPGAVVRTAAGDLAAAEGAFAAPVSGLLFDPLPVGTAPDAANAPAVAAVPALQGDILAPTLRFWLQADLKRRELEERLAPWAADAGLPAEPLPALLDLGASEKLKARVADYVKRFTKLPLAPEGTRWVGYAALLDGAVLTFETFDAPEHLAASWPGLLCGLAAEAAIEESRQGLLDEEIPPSVDPDRFLGALRRRLVALYGEVPTSRPAGAGTALILRTEAGDVARALVLGDVLRHLVVVTDPALRGPETPGEEFDPGVIDRKARPTEAERRWKERRDQRGGTPPTPPVPPAPPPREE